MELREIKVVFQGCIEPSKYVHDYKVKTTENINKK